MRIEILPPAKHCVIWIIGLTLFGLCPSAWAELEQVFPEERWHIALDPGHGGDDTGARGPTGLQEKTVCLELARNLALRLEARYRVTLTRSDDYHVQLPQRAAIANQVKANLYISLHTAASFQHAERGAVIFYHDSSTSNADRPTDQNTPPTTPLPWHLVQTRHQAGSQALAQLLKPQLDKHLGNQDVRIAKAPLAPLVGVDMPAVLIEIGHITQPAMEQRMASTQGIASLAQAIETAIHAYIQSKTTPPRQ